MRNNPLDLTFFAWSDAHLGYAQRFDRADIRGAAISQMNRLPGWPCPRRIGGRVGKPAFVVHCGDIVDGGRDLSGGAKFDLFRYFTGKLNFPHHEVLGNHEISGTNAQFMRYYMKRYGARSYFFVEQGICFLALAGEYDANERGCIPTSELNFLERTLRRIGRENPVALLLHSPINELANPEDVLRRLRKSNVILSMAGHKHQAGVFRVENIPCVNIGHCRNHPIDLECGRSFYVVRITDDRITAAAWRWDLEDWEKGAGWSAPRSVEKRLMLIEKRK